MGYALDDGADNIYGDGDGVGVDVETIPPTETSSPNAQLIYDASTEQNDKILRDLESFISFTDTYELASLAINVSLSLDSKYTGSIRN